MNEEFVKFFTIINYRYRYYTANECSALVTLKQSSVSLFYTLEVMKIIMNN